MKNVIKVLSLFLFSLIFVGCSSTSKTVDNENQQKVEENLPLNIKHDFENRTIYIGVASSPNHKTKKLLRLVAREEVASKKKDQCLVLQRVVKWEDSVIKFPYGTEWKTSRVSETEFDIVFPPQTEDQNSKTVRYEKTKENPLKGCQINKDPRNFMEGEEKTI